MGQPPILKWSAGVSGGMYLRGGTSLFAGYAQIGVFKDLINPVTGGPGLKFEGYAGIRGSDEFDGGLRALLAIPFIGLAGGVDYNFQDEKLDFLLRLSFNIQRGGVLRSGGRVHVDWVPDRGNSFNVGLTVPLNDRRRGRTRPRRIDVAIEIRHIPLVSYDDPDSEAALEESLAAISNHMHWINRLTSPFLDQGGKNRDQALGALRADLEELKAHLTSTGLSFEAEIRAYHRELDRAFSIAASGRALTPGESTPLGRQIAARAKAIALEEMIFPYNRLLGMAKKPDSTVGFGARADSILQDWLTNASAVPAERIRSVHYVFQRILGFSEEEREYSKGQWGESRLIWMPLHYALLPEDYDTREELDHLLERAVGVQFTTGNRVWYIANSDFQLELARTVERAEDYQVLWIHDVRGVNKAGDPDQVTYYQMVDIYLRTLTERVRQYDLTGKLPVYLILLDQHYYEINKSRKWMNLLERPLDHRMSFPAAFRWMEGGVRRAQAELRAAVEASERLQADAQRYGEKWLKSLVKVHVNVTNPADDSYWSNQFIPLLGYPDNIMRDHRKIAFYDITEEDPYKGGAIYSGMGIGEHYVGPGWEDRAILAEGPAVLGMKYAARELLLSQGFSEEQIPYPLKPRPKAPDYDERVQRRVAEGWNASALELHNETGYLDKPINVFKAVLYSTMPKGSVVNIPDSLWNSTFFASLLFGSCLRGVQVMIINPSKNNAPGQSFTTLSRAQELFARLIVIQEVMAYEIGAAGGLLKTGLYDPAVDVRDLPSRVKLMRDGIRANPWLDELVGFDRDTWEVLDRVDELLAGFTIDTLLMEAGTERPQLHLKINFFASDVAWSAVLSRPEFALFLRDLMSRRARDLIARGEVARVVNETKTVNLEDYPGIKEAWDAVDAVGNTVLTAARTGLTRDELEQAMAYLLVGSPNQDYRSMFMDGEVMLAVAGAAALPGLLDILFLSGVSTWVDDLDSLEQLLPGYGSFKFRISRKIKQAL